MDDLETWKTRAQQAEMVLREVRAALDGSQHDWLPGLAKHRMAQRSADLAIAERCVSERMAMAEALRDLQQSIASALFGAARDDDRVPISSITGAMVDALCPDGLIVPTAFGQRAEEDSIAQAEAFIREENKRHGA